MTNWGDAEEAAPFALPILDPAFKADPHGVYDALRQCASVARIRLPSGAEAWTTTTYAAARALLGDVRLVKRRAGEPQPSAAKGEGEPEIFRHLLAMDPPRHTALRALLAPHFSAVRVHALAPRVHALVDELLAAASLRGAFDVVCDFANPLAYAVACEVAGVPPAGRQALAVLLDALDSADFEAPEQVPDIARSLRDALTGWLRRSEGGAHGGVLASLAPAVCDGSLEPAQAAALVFLVLAAGRETTANLVAAGVLRLLADRTAWRALGRDPAAAGRLVEELLRLEGPLEMATARHAVSDIEIDGVTIPAGACVYVGLAAGNRDPARFGDPWRLDPGRERPTQHLAFGHGVHKCIGAALARMEARIALAGLACRFPRLRLSRTSEPAWKPGLIARGLRTLPVLADAGDDAA